MTLDGALRDDHDALRLGFARLIPAKDPVGRSIVFVDPSRLDASQYERESMCRAVWYVLHASLENPRAQMFGNVMLGYPKNVQVTQVDRELMKLNMESIRGCIPVRISALLICQPPGFFAKIVFPIMKLFLGEVSVLQFVVLYMSMLCSTCISRQYSARLSFKRLRKRIMVFSGTEKQVMKELKKFGLTKDKVPSELSGQVVLDHDSWLNNRKESNL